MSMSGLSDLAMPSTEAKARATKVKADGKAMAPESAAMRVELTREVGRSLAATLEESDRYLSDEHLHRCVARSKHDQVGRRSDDARCSDDAERHDHADADGNRELGAHDDAAYYSITHTHDHTTQIISLLRRPPLLPLPLPAPVRKRVKGEATASAT